MRQAISYTLITLFALGFFFTAFAVYADETNSTETTLFEQQREQLKERAEQMKQEAQEQMEQTREEMQAHMEDAREEAKDSMENAREEAKENMEQARETFQMEMENRREEMRQRGFETARERIAQNMNRFTAIIEKAVERVEKIIERVESRIALMNADGLDTSEAQTHLDSAKESLRLALEKAGEVGDVSLTDETPRETIAAYKEILREAHELIKEASNSVREAVNALKELLNPEDENTEESTDSE